MRLLKYTLLVPVLALVLGVAGCDKRSDTEKAMDKTADAAKDAANKTGDAAKDAANKAKDAVK
jgi:hypothetical protein